ncbi:MAG: hypothetical protein JO010_14305 [Alphaproteobacteria bacterium]|nr:hypothetical protein [Alphaproteobacteria bacterium]
MAAPAKRSVASLIGGIAVAIGIFILWLVVTAPVSASTVIPGAVLAGAIGFWVRLADL